MLLEYALEMLRILGMREHAGPRQIQVIQPRYPEAQRAGAQHDRPSTALDSGERPNAVIRREQRCSALAAERSVGRDAPVVDRDRDIIEQHVVAGEIEVDDA